MDYKTYRLTIREKLLILPVSVAGSVVVSWLFYDSWYGIFLFPGVYLLLALFRRQQQKEKVRKQLAEEFLDTLRTISTSLLAGYSMENAMKEALKEVGMLRGKEGLMYRELRTMNRLISMNVPLEQILEDFALRSGNEDVEEFAAVFRFAKRGGGNLTSIIEGTVLRMTDRFETEKEIQVVIASRKLEQKIMDLVPLGIIAYLKVGSGDYLDPLYHNPFGVIFMTICLVLYGGALYVSGKVMDIHV